MAFEFQKLIVFRRALDAAEAVDSLVRAMPESRFRLKDQIRRSTDSLVLNIAEGSGEFTAREKARFYRIARRSACETAGALHLAVRYHALQSGRIGSALALLDETAAMLTTMCNRLNARARVKVRVADADVREKRAPLTASASARPRPGRTKEDTSK